MHSALWILGIVSLEVPGNLITARAYLSQATFAALSGGILFSNPKSKKATAT
jgi:hypothetical protein